MAGSGDLKASRVSAITAADSERTLQLRRARACAVLGIILVGAIAWWFVIASDAQMVAMSGAGVLGALMRAMMQPQATAPYLAATALMWVAMMTAMMTPAVLPMVITFWRLDRGGETQRITDGILFSASYLAVWGGFGLAMTALQWVLHSHSVLALPELAATPLLAASLVIVAGVYQLTPFKAACLAHCRTPVGFLLSHWRSGALGAMRMGLAHGSYCLGCCWALMLVMFAGGVMSLSVMALVSGLILAERLLPGGLWVSKLPGVVLITLGGWLMSPYL